MVWNYRVIANEEINPYYTIHEVYYYDGQPITLTENRIAAFGESVEELRSDMQLMIKALDKPVLKREDFK